MNEQVIAAAQQAFNESMRYRLDESASPPVYVVEGDIEAAIRAADRARAEAGYVLVPPDLVKRISALLGVTEDGQTIPWMS